MVRYVSIEDVQDHLELDTLNDIDDPKLKVAEKWVEASENEVDNLTRNRWDVHIVQDELISPDCQTQDFVLAERPLKRVISFEYQKGDQWSNDWQTIPVSDYRIINPSISKVRTKDYYWAEEGLRISYEVGYEIIPSWLKELTLLLVEKRYLMSRLGIAASDPETVSVAVIRIKDKSNASLKYRVDGLQKEIDDRLRLLGKRMKSRNASIGFLTMYTPPNKRYRLY